MTYKRRPCDYYSNPPRLNYCKLFSGESLNRVIQNEKSHGYVVYLTQSRPASAAGMEKSSPKNFLLPCLSDYVKNSVQNDVSTTIFMWLLTRDLFSELHTIYLPLKQKSEPVAQFLDIQHST